MQSHSKTVFILFSVSILKLSDYHVEQRTSNLDEKNITCVENYQGNSITGLKRRLRLRERDIYYETITN